MKVSFIVPVYKIEQYLSQCVESILAQTYKDIEIVLVDDGSPDNCPKICDDWAQKDNRIKTLHKKNGGLSEARNVGLKESSGVYVVFVDGDDFWLKKNSLEVLVRIAKEHPELDFIGFNCKYYYPGSNNMKPWVMYNECLQKPVDKNIATISLVMSGTFPMSACLKFMKRSFLVENLLDFKKNQIAEDIPWFINMLDRTTSCSFVNEYIYAYRQNVSGSITNTSGRKSFDSLFNIFKTELELVEGRSFSEKAKAAIRSFLAYEYCILLTYNGIDKETKKDLWSYKNVLNYDMNPKVKKVSKWYKTFGIRFTTILLSVYRKVKRNY